MKITSAEFVKSAFNAGHWTTDGLPEIAFLGRSNVGKSSLLNSLLQRRGLARTSNTPGRTQSINFFLINESFYFTDLPGYGYAKVSKAMRSDWGEMAEEYLLKRRELILSIQLVDSRHAPTALDIQLHEWLTHHHKNNFIVATKADKLSNNKLRKSLQEIERALQPESLIVPYSSLTGKGREAVWREIENSLRKS
ncbi:MAG: ribosome biogenesis GTP-binding protein YihA/YsxC [Pyrinomonadaceae bacterium]